MDINYLEAKEFARDSFNEFHEEDNFTLEQSIAAALEDNILPIKRNKLVYEGVIVELSLICLRNKFVPDYIYEHINVIINNICFEKNKNTNNDFLNDIIEIKKLLANQDYTISKDEIYKLRVDYLLRG